MPLETDFQDDGLPGELPSAARQPSPVRRSLFCLYVLGVASGGLYLLYWIYDALRGDTSSRELSDHPWVGAIGSAVPPVRAALLYDIQRRSRERQGLPVSRLDCAFPAAVALLLGLVLALFPSRVLWTPGWLLAPLPFLWVQARLNREVAVAPIGLGDRRLAAQVLIVLLGAAVAFPIAWFYDIPEARILSRPFALQGDAVAGESALYSVKLPTAAWRRVPPGTLTDDEETDLELLSADGQSWLASYVYLARDRPLHDIVSSRRIAISEIAPLQSFNEERFFGDSLELVLISKARYEIGKEAWVRQHYQIYTAQQGDRVIEVISSSTHDDAPLSELIESIELTAPEVAP